MGLNYSYVLIIQQSDEQKLLAYLSQNGVIDELPGPMGTCLALEFPLDELILNYLKDTIRDSNRDSSTSRPLLRKSEYRAYFPNDTTGRVGCIYLEIKPILSSHYAYIKFTAATSDMSRLLKASRSIRSWFLQLSSCFDTTAAFLDLEEQGYEFIYRQGRPFAATLTEDLMVIQAADIDSQVVVTICQDYANLFFE